MAALLSRLRTALAALKRWRWLAPILALIASLLLARRSGREDAEHRIERDTDDHLIHRHQARSDADRAARTGDARTRLRERFGDGGAE